MKICKFSKSVNILRQPQIQNLRDKFTFFTYFLLSLTETDAVKTEAEIS